MHRGAFVFWDWVLSRPADRFLVDRISDIAYSRRFLKDSDEIGVHVHRKRVCVQKRALLFVHEHTTHTAQNNVGTAGRRKTTSYEGGRALHRLEAIRALRADSSGKFSSSKFFVWPLFSVARRSGGELG